MKYEPAKQSEKKGFKATELQAAPGANVWQLLLYLGFALHLGERLG